MNHADSTTDRVEPHSGSKYLRKINGTVDGMVDVYSVLIMFDVRCPARQHAIKKLLCSGIRGKGDSLQDLREAADAIQRAIEIEADRIASGRKTIQKDEMDGVPEGGWKSPVFT